MYMETTRIDRANARPLSPATWSYEDPLDPDRPEDDVVVTTKRGLCRVAMVAAEVGGRFQREGLEHDPMAWMLAPRDLFRGGAAIEACLGRDDFLRATLLHGLGLGMDAEAEEIDELLEEDVTDDGRRTENESGRATLSEPFGGLMAGRHLFTAVIAYMDEDISLHAFHASLAERAEEVVDRLIARHGLTLAAKATIVVGMDAADATVTDLVSPSTMRLLRQIERDPEAAFADGLVIDIEQRFDG